MLYGTCESESWWRFWNEGGNNTFPSRVLGLVGLAISIGGTAGMFWGGLESFIVVKTRVTMESVRQGDCNLF